MACRRKRRYSSDLKKKAASGAAGSTATLDSTSNAWTHSAPHKHTLPTLRALSVLRVTANGCMWKYALQDIAQGSARCFQAGLMRLTDDVG